jgi:hypothetical protein
VWESRAQGFRGEGAFVGFANNKEKRYVVVRPGPPLADLANLFLLQGGDKTGRVFFAWFDGKPEGKTPKLEPRWYELSYKLRAGVGGVRDVVNGE